MDAELGLLVTALFLRGRNAPPPGGSSADGQLAPSPSAFTSDQPGSETMMSSGLSELGPAWVSQARGRGPGVGRQLRAQRHTGAEGGLP